jgi:hypothetical protein
MFVVDGTYNEWVQRQTYKEQAMEAKKIIMASAFWDDGKVCLSMFCTSSLTRLSNEHCAAAAYTLRQHTISYQALVCCCHARHSCTWWGLPSICCIWLTAMCLAWASYIMAPSKSRCVILRAVIRASTSHAIPAPHLWIASDTLRKHLIRAPDASCRSRSRRWICGQPASLPSWRFGCGAGK